jgi:TPR repeat protein
MISPITAITLALIAPALLSGCAQPNPVDSLYCMPATRAVKPSSDYARFSSKELEDKGTAGFWGLADLTAARVLGERYAEGQGVPQDFAKAADWYTTAAVAPTGGGAVYVPGVGGHGGSVLILNDRLPNAGDPIALHRLGELYAAGKGVPRDLPRAQKLLTCASGQSVPNG